MMQGLVMLFSMQSDSCSIGVQMLLSPSGLLPFLHLSGIVISVSWTIEKERVDITI